MTDHFQITIHKSKLTVRYFWRLMTLMHSRRILWCGLDELQLHRNAAMMPCIHVTRTVCSMYFTGQWINCAVFLKTYDTYVFKANFMAWVCQGCSVNIQLDKDCIHRWQPADVIRTICSLYFMEELTNGAILFEDLWHLRIHGYLGPRLYFFTL